MADRDLYGASDRSYAIDRPQQTAFRNYHPSSPGATPMTPWMVKENEDRRDLYLEGLRRDIEGDYSNRQPGFGVGNLRTVRPPLNPFVNPRGMRRGIETLDPTGPGWIDDNYYSPEHPIWGQPQQGRHRRRFGEDASIGDQANLWQTWQDIKDRLGEEAADNWLASQQIAANRGGLMSLA